MLLEAALELAERGFRVLPCQFKKSLLDPIDSASSDPEQVREWWARHPTASIGIYTIGLLVFDVDIEPTDGFEAVRRVEERFGKLPATLRTRTGSGGEHIYFRLPNAMRLWKPGKKEGLSLHSEGVYVIAPPSLHASGRRYEWIDPAQPIAEAPGWLVKLASS